MNRRVAFLILTSQCNRACPYCFYETGYQDRGDSSAVLDVDEGLLDPLRQAGVGHLIFTGGEPLLLPNVENAVALAAHLGFTTLLLTNGDLLSRSRIETLARAGLEGITVSLDALKAGDQGKAPWIALHHLRAVGSIHGAVIVPVTRINLPVLPAILRRIDSLGLYVLLQPAFLPPENAEYARLSLKGMNPAEAESFEALLDLWASLYGRTRYVELLKDFYDRGEIKPECSMGTASIVIEPDGDVLPCFHRRDLKAGNLLNTNPSDILSRAFAKGARLKSAPCFGEHCLSLFSHM
jgi:MoaA/NifB/PqqE/SkfB family radical SAM enzyme